MKGKNLKILNVQVHEKFPSIKHLSQITPQSDKKNVPKANPYLVEESKHHKFQNKFPTSSKEILNIQGELINKNVNNSIKPITVSEFKRENFIFQKGFVTKYRNMFNLIDQEQFQDNNIKLVKSMKRLQEENTILNIKFTEVKFKSEESEKQIKELYEQIKKSSGTGDQRIQNQKMVNVIEGNSNLVKALRKQIKDLKNENVTNDKKIIELSKNLKSTKCMELELQLQIIEEEKHNLLKLQSDIFNEKSKSTINETDERAYYLEKNIKNLKQENRKLNELINKKAYEIKELNLVKGDLDKKMYSKTYKESKDLLNIKKENKKLIDDLKTLFKNKNPGRNLQDNSSLADLQEINEKISKAKFDLNEKENIKKNLFEKLKELQNQENFKVKNQKQLYKDTESIEEDKSNINNINNINDSNNKNKYIIDLDNGDEMKYDEYKKMTLKVLEKIKKSYENSKDSFKKDVLLENFNLNENVSKNEFLKILNLSPFNLDNINDSTNYSNYIYQNSSIISKAELKEKILKSIFNNNMDEAKENNNNPLNEIVKVKDKDREKEKEKEKEIEIENENENEKETKNKIENEKEKEKEDENENDNKNEKNDQISHKINLDENLSLTESLQKSISPNQNVSKSLSNEEKQKENTEIPEIPEIPERKILNDVSENKINNEDDRNNPLGLFTNKQNTEIITKVEQTENIKETENIEKFEKHENIENIEKKEDKLSVNELDNNFSENQERNNQIKIIESHDGNFSSDFRKEGNNASETDLKNEENLNIKDEKINGNIDFKKEETEQKDKDYGLIEIPISKINENEIKKIESEFNNLSNLSPSIDELKPKMNSEPLLNQGYKNDKAEEQEEVEERKGMEEKEKKEENIKSERKLQDDLLNNFQEDFINAKKEGQTIESKRNEAEDVAVAVAVPEAEAEAEAKAKEEYVIETKNESKIALNEEQKELIIKPNNVEENQKSLSQEIQLNELHEEKLTYENKCAINNDFNHEVQQSEDGLNANEAIPTKNISDDNYNNNDNNNHNNNNKEIDTLIQNFVDVMIKNNLSIDDLFSPNKYFESNNANASNFMSKISLYNNMEKFGCQEYIRQLEELLNAFETDPSQEDINAFGLANILRNDGALIASEIDKIEKIEQIDKIENIGKIEQSEKIDEIENNNETKNNANLAYLNLNLKSIDNEILVLLFSIEQIIEKSNKTIEDFFDLSPDKIDKIDIDIDKNRNENEKVIKIEEFYDKLEKEGLHTNESERFKISQLLEDHSNSNPQIISLEKFEKIKSEMKSDTILYQQIQDLYLYKESHSSSPIYKT